MLREFKKKLSPLKKQMVFKIKIIFEQLCHEERYPYKKYCDIHKCIFIHIPKNAGSSVIKLLNNHNSIEQEHCTYWEYLRADEQRFQAYEKFCIVRNPWDRLFSAYNYLKNGGNKGSDQALSEMVNRQCDHFADFVMNWLDADKVYNITVLTPQFMYFYDFHNQHMMIDNLLRFESLSSDFALLQDKLEIAGKLPWVNKSTDKQYQQYYNQEMIDKVKTLYHYDIDLLGYNFSE
jgi:chondroitin 4-sulfotransferase 11